MALVFLLLFTSSSEQRAGDRTALHIVREWQPGSSKERLWLNDYIFFFNGTHKIRKCFKGGQKKTQPKAAIVVFMRETRNSGVRAVAFGFDSREGFSLLKNVEWRP